MSIVYLEKLNKAQALAALSGQFPVRQSGTNRDDSGAVPEYKARFQLLLSYIFSL